jgi:predicted ATPase/class 3 adenylate cyclase
MTELPAGAVTFLFTDIEGSTRLLGQHPKELAAALVRHDALMRDAVAASGGVVFETVGDAVYAAFFSPTDAVAAALSAQLALARENWGVLGALKVRMGLHGGDVELRGTHYFGAPLYRCARLMSIGHGAQTLLSETTAAAVRASLPDRSALRDMGTHHLKDLNEPERVFQLLHPDLPADFPALKSLRPRPNNLPTPPTTFIGRAREREELKRLVRESRLVTLTGSGGTGKTRLALQVATEALNGFNDGVFFVPLAAIKDAALVLPAIASTLGLREQPGVGLGMTLAAELASKEMLLILDNLEQVASARTAIADLVARAPRLTIMATSRVPLHVTGEHVFALAPFEVRNSGAGRRDIQGLARSDAVVLFLQHALAIAPDLSLSEENVIAIADICAFFEGVPLAIELAASRANVLSPVTMLPRLRRRLSASPVVPGGAQERQDSLRTVIAWSEDLLTTEVKQMFAELALFVGGWTLEGVEEVCTPSQVDPIEALSMLVDHSLVRRDLQPDGGSRFSMLETIREYALERLEQSGSRAQIQRAHGLYFMRLTENFGTASMTYDATIAEHENIRAAIAAASDRDDDADVRRRIVAAVWSAFVESAHLREMTGWLADAIAARRADLSPLQAQLLTGAGIAARIRGDSAAAVGYLRDAVDIRRQMGDDIQLSYALSALASALFDSDLDAAYRAGDESVALARAGGNLRALAHALGNRAEADRYGGRESSALALNEEALSLARKIGDRRLLAIGLHNVALLRLRSGGLEAAAELLREAVDVAIVARQSVGVAYCVAALAGVAVVGHQPERAATLLAAADAAFDLLNATMNGTDRREFERYRETCRLELGEPSFADAWSRGAALSLDEAADLGRQLASADGPISS